MNFYQFALVIHAILSAVYTQICLQTAFNCLFLSSTHEPIVFLCYEEYSEIICYAGGLQKKVESLSLTARQKADAPIVQSGVPDVDPESMKQVFDIVSQQATAIERLQGVLKRANRDLAIMEKEKSLGF